MVRRGKATAAAAPAAADEDDDDIVESKGIDANESGMSKAEEEVEVEEEDSCLLKSTSPNRDLSPRQRRMLAVLVSLNSCSRIRA